jgi:hypothetical protein
MELKIKRYSQETDIDDPSSISNFIVIQDEKGQEHRVRVAQETIMDIMKINLPATEHKTHVGVGKPVAFGPEFDTPPHTTDTDEDDFTNPPDGMTDPDDEESFEVGTVPDGDDPSSEDEVPPL